MLFSIVTISFNQARWLGEAIDSVLAQAGPGVEIDYIVCDPGSKDDSRTIIDSYGPRIAHRVYEKDDGPADGLNRGFARASGEVFCYLNSDDVFLPGAFARVAAAFARHPEVDVFTGHGFAIDAESRVLRRIWSESHGRLRAGYSSHRQIQPSTFIRAEAFRKCGGFDPADRIMWDGDLLNSLYLSGARIRLLDAWLSGYRLHDESITSSGRGEEARDKAEDWQFERLIGRKPGKADRALRKALELSKHVSHPLRSFERIAYGPLYRRGQWQPSPLTPLARTLVGAPDVQGTGLKPLA
ncbi:MAG: glycosyltransferase [Sphingomonadales bacterium]|nr:glycosyltransferase [Sphingomonadales bacterium]